MNDRTVSRADRIERDSFLWNMTGSLLNAFQSVFFLMVLTRRLGLSVSGIFTIAYADANLFLNIGKYGMRYYQVSDVAGRFSFRQYRLSRWITTVVMIVVAAVFVSYMSYGAGYTREKSFTILWMCLFKAVDSVEDVYHGEWQRHGRLDIAGLAMTVRMFLTIILFIGAILVTNDLLLSTAVSTVFTTVLLVILLIVGDRKLKVDKAAGASIGSIDMGRSEVRDSIQHLFLQCLPLFAGAFLSFYIGNAPKYAIDAQLPSELQAIYGFLSMPVFVVGLLNGFVFNPVIGRLSQLWHEGDVRGFMMQSAKQVGWLTVITLVCILGGWLLGIPVLSLLYGTDLNGYLAELLILLLGGGLLGLSGLISTLITIIRYQNSLLIGYALVSAAAFLMAGSVVSHYGLMGASVIYTVLMGGLCVVFVVCLWIGIRVNS